MDCRPITCWQKGGKKNAGPLRSAICGAYTGAVRKRQGGRFAGSKNRYSKINGLPMWSYDTTFSSDQLKRSGAPEPAAFRPFHEGRPAEARRTSGSFSGTFGNFGESCRAQSDVVAAWQASFWGGCLPKSHSQKNGVAATCVASCTADIQFIIVFEAEKIARSGMTKTPKNLLVLMRLLG